MRLKSIKLAGFKSFVDPTTVILEHNLTAIVGPNGCGKSNVIDAVRWVMGESSAKNLRGESITDVIFNGSSSRKPVGLAFIELIFDNSDGTVAGEMGNFSEISIKRSVNREAQSLYFLNGTRCRRKDITGIFLGTGLGPRSYAIIEQGTISRLIEAKPEDLRIFIEEAAGISKYKERRRETENRMRRTRENLERLNDVREELNRQLQHLHRQAQSAEKYKNFKVDERLLKAQLQALRWRGLDKQIQVQAGVIREIELKREERVTVQVNIDTALEKHHSELTALNADFNTVQGSYYGVGAEIARLEQSIQHQQQREMEIKRDLEQAIENYNQASEHLQNDEALIEKLNFEIETLEPEWEMLQEAQAESAETLLQAEDAMQGWQREWDQFNATASKSSQTAQIEQSRIEQREQSIQRSVERINRLKVERESFQQGSDLDDDIALLVEQLSEQELQVQALEEKQCLIRSQIEQQRTDNNRVNAELDQFRGELQSKKGRFSSLEALQQAALGDGDKQVNSWLDKLQLENATRFAEQLEVNGGWETAVEAVLGKKLQSVCIDKLSQVSSHFDTFKGGLHFVSLDQSATGSSVPHDKAPALLDYVRSQHSARHLLAGIYCVENIDDALLLKSSLEDTESVVTRDGIWLGENWLYISRQENSEAGVLARRQQIEHLAFDIEKSDEQIEMLSDQLSINREQLLNYEQQRETVSGDLSQGNRAVSDIKAQLSAKEVRLEQFAMRRQRLESDLKEASALVESEQQTLGESRLILQDALEIMAEDELRREALLETRDSKRGVLDEIRQTARTHKDEAHRMALQIQSLKTQCDSTGRGLQRLTTQYQQLKDRKNKLMESLAEVDCPVDEQQAILEGLLEKRLLIEEKMAEARAALEIVDHKRQALEKQRSEAEQLVQGYRNQLESLRIEAQGLEVRCATALEQLSEQQFDLQVVLDNLPAETSESLCAEELDKIASRISRLGAINLAAIDEYQKESERKAYLDAQHADLMEALETLENAIRKIDKETRDRFKETFDKVNSGIQELFPKVFGGGHAYLELTGDDLLDTGVAIMARPPGKRNSTIHLLSGGEKALTAIALVFSIFRLNPAPFCMLDEVDAPLDDTNVGRFCRLVSEMSKSVQFIYISHNKVAMEMAHVLMGVTMQEPGVSRLVSVDVDEAAAMAAL